MLILVNDIMENNETEMVRTHEEDGGEQGDLKGLYRSDKRKQTKKQPRNRWCDDLKDDR